MGGWEKITDAKVTIVDSPRGDLSEEDTRPSLVILIREEVPIFESGIEDMELDHINEEPLISPLPFVSQTTQQPQNSAQPPKSKPVVETPKQPDHLSIGLLHLDPRLRHYLPLVLPPERKLIKQVFLFLSLSGPNLDGYLFYFIESSKMKC